MVKNLLANAGDLGSVLSGENPSVKETQHTTVFLPEKSHGQRNLEAIVHGVTKSWT